MIGLEMGETIASAIRVRSSDSSNAQLLLHIASIDNNFISENGMVVVFGDESNAVGRGRRLGTSALPWSGSRVLQLTGRCEEGSRAV